MPTETMHHIAPFSPAGFLVSFIGILLSLFASILPALAGQLLEDVHLSSDMPEACRAALTTSLESCPNEVSFSLNWMVFDEAKMYADDKLSGICSAGCQEDFDGYLDEVRRGCGDERAYKIFGAEGFPIAVAALQLWVHNAMCAVDIEGFCIKQDMDVYMNGCSECRFYMFSNMLSLESTAAFANVEEYSSILSSCSATSFSGATSIGLSPLAADATPTATGEAVENDFMSGGTDFSYGLSMGFVMLGAGISGAMMVF